MLDRQAMSELRHAFVSGKYAIGIAAVNQVNNSLNQRQLTIVDTDKLKDASDEDKYWIGDGSIKFQKYNRVTVSGKAVATLSMMKNQAGEYISDIVSQFIDGFVDISKDPWIMRLGATPNVVSTFLFLAKIGVPIRTVAFFMNQPIILDYIKSIENDGYSWLFMDNYVEATMDIYDVDIDPQQFNSDHNYFTIPSEEALGETLGKKVSELNKLQRLDQHHMLIEFLKYAKMAGHMYLFTQGSNFDTASINDPSLIFKKQEQLKLAQNSIISSVDETIENSFLGKLFDSIRTMRDGLYVPGF